MKASKKPLVLEAMPDEEVAVVGALIFRSPTLREARQQTNSDVELSILRNFVNEGK